MFITVIIIKMYFLAIGYNMPFTFFAIVHNHSSSFQSSCYHKLVVCIELTSDLDLCEVPGGVTVVELGVP